MIISIHKSHNTLSYRILSAFIAFTFIFSLALPPGYAQLIPQTLLNLPAPGTMVAPSPGFMPVLLTGLTIHPDNPLRFDFIMDTGHSGLDIHSEEFKQESAKLIRYFMASLTTPEEELWVNLSPYEKDRMIPADLGKTEMGRDMLAQDYLLKQLTASLMYPEQDLGKEFWKRVYQKAREKFGTTEIPLNTFNKIWIVPEDALVYEQDGSAFVIHSKLAVMLEEDYEALRQSKNTAELASQDTVVSGLQSQVVREVLIPEITKEINEGENFANLRQIFNALILATWYKVRLKESLLGKVYVNQGKTKGIDVQDKEINDKIYTQYLEAFKKGVYNYIREDYDESTQQIIPRKYFSGGVSAARMRNGKWFSQFLVTGGLVLGLTAFSALPLSAQEKGKDVLEGVGNQAGVTAEFVENPKAPDDVTVTVRNGENVRPVLLAQAKQRHTEIEYFENALKQKIEIHGHGAVPFLKKLYYDYLPENPFGDSLENRRKRLAIVKAFGEAGLSHEDGPFLGNILEGTWFRREYYGPIIKAVSEGGEVFERLRYKSLIEKLELEQKERVNGVYGWRLGVEGSRMLDIKELTPLNAAEVFNDIVRLASESRKFRDINDPDTLALARTLKYEKREDGHQISFKGKPILGQWASSQQLEIFKVNGNPAVHFTSTTIYLEIPGDSEHLLTIDRTNYFILMMPRWEWEHAIDQLSFLGGKIVPGLQTVADTPASSPVGMKSLLKPTPLIRRLISLGMVFLFSLPLLPSSVQALDDAEAQRIAKNFAKGIASLADPYILAPSHYGHPGFENVTFLYDATIHAALHKVSGDQKRAEATLDYFFKKLRTDPLELQARANLHGLIGIIQLVEAYDGSYTIASINNAVDRSSQTALGRATLEFGTTPGPMDFLGLIALYVNPKKYLNDAIHVGNVIRAMQRRDGGVVRGTMNREKVDSEPHFDSIALFAALEKFTGDPQWKKAREAAQEWARKNVVQQSVVWQGILGVNPGQPNKTFAVDGHTWTFGGVYGEDLSAQTLERYAKSVLEKALVQVTLPLPDGREEKILTVNLVDFTDPLSIEAQGVREGIRPQGSPEWTGGLILQL